ncbi:MAG TPA: DUF1415 domain-containing protein [Oxalicibacterium sp.]|uniref:DUF1415 domain-containing protein n=1 Tax=Oxalicibacterium sp. TaxID=2766525 RepID=UPI002CE11DA5|nr:DUF1415 domain-containing protein [Oxalicibacterium sp.]HWU96945.1 DUF1415 domain-containing protein [Oxalicibacterium sp.]
MPTSSRIEPAAESVRESAIAAVQTWIEKAVIGLNLCPFAKAVHVKKQIRYVVSTATDEDALLEELAAELHTLHMIDAEVTDTTLLILTGMLADFLDYNDFLDSADELIETLELDGEIQIASFHPDYQFAGTQADDIENYTNRSPYPILHLLRESSIDQAVAAYPDAKNIYEKNMETLRRIGHSGWQALNLNSRKQ